MTVVKNGFHKNISMTSMHFIDPLFTYMRFIDSLIFLLTLFYFNRPLNDFFAFLFIKKFYKFFFHFFQKLI